MSGERTERASPRRKQKAREQGDGVRSRDLISAAAMLAGTVALGWAGPQWAARWAQAFQALLAQAAPASWVDGQADTKVLALRSGLAPVLTPLGPIFAAAVGGALLGGVAQGGGLGVHVQTLAWKPQRLNPFSNLRQLVSARGLTRLAKSALPVAALGWFVAARVREQMAIPVFSLSRLPEMFGSVYGLMIDAAVILFVWSALDYFVEWRSWEGRLRMSKEEVKEEFKQTEGNPQVRRRIASIRRQLRRRTLKADVSRASVVITNPTHYAVALQFSLELMEAPRLLAKGRDLVAAQIRQEALWAGVPIVENPPLARALYKQVEAGQAIPFALYAAVAAILAWLYRRQVEEQLRRQGQPHPAPESRQAGPREPDLRDPDSGSRDLRNRDPGKQEPKNQEPKNQEPKHQEPR
jgi:flagellar biosynthesis protein FlhB